MPKQSIVKKSSLYKWGRRKAFAAKLMGCSRSQPLASAIRNTSANMLTGEERKVIADIERLRLSLENNQDTIVVQDYGAVKPNKQQSREGKDQGVTAHRKIGDICRSASKDQFWCMFLFHVIRQFKPNRCIEMGTCLGISAAFIASALRLNGSGSLVTLDGSHEQADIARATFQQLDLDNVSVRVGRFQETLIPTLEEMSPVNFVFVDGHHDGNATRQYFDTIRQYLDAENVVIFDDIRWSEGMRNAWQSVRSGAEAYDLGPVGACVNVGMDSQGATASGQTPAAQSQKRPERCDEESRRGGD